MKNRLIKVCVAWALVGAAPTWASPQVKVDPLLVQACNGRNWQTHLGDVAPDQAGVEKPQARAIWLDGERLQWPGAAAVNGEAIAGYALAHSNQGRIRVVNGQLFGAQRQYPLVIDSSAAAWVAAAQAPWVAKFSPDVSVPVLTLPGQSVARLRELHQGQLMLVALDAKARVLAHTLTQAARALDALYALAQAEPDLGVSWRGVDPVVKVWAPTARAVTLCVYPVQGGNASRVLPMVKGQASGVWSQRVADKTASQTASNYTFLVDVWVQGLGWVRNRVTDPYSVSLNANGKRSALLNLADPRLAPSGWAQRIPSQRVKSATDMAIYELHVRDFSINDASVPEPLRGKYRAFTQSSSLGMGHLKALADAGMTDVHLLPVFDIATIPELGCVSPKVSGAPDSSDQQQAVGAVREADCFNWGYDPLHYTAPEGSYATDANDPSVRVRELREMVMALNQTGLRVGMDVVYNHTPAAGQDEKSVLDRIVPNYYQRLNAAGGVESSTCCANTATEHAMMAKLMIESAVTWVTHYGIDSFRFDLMGHQPRSVMERLQLAVNRAAGRSVQLIGEGWNFGEVENGQRFVQASQLSLNGSGIGTFSDRTRDAVRGGSWSDNSEQLLANQGWANGLFFDPSPQAIKKNVTPADLARAADMVRVGLAGSLRDFQMDTFAGPRQRLDQLKYGDSPAGYVSQPTEVVNYVDNHDNPTLFDINAFKMPPDTPSAERARAQVVAIAVTALSQGVAYFHAGVEVLRSKSLDRNSYDSGDWFNRLDWTYQDNYFATGLPPKQDNGNNWGVMKPLLANPFIKPSPQDIRFTLGASLDLLKIRASSKLFRLDTAEQINARLRFHNTGPGQVGAVVMAELNGQGLPGANFSRIVYAINADKAAHTITVPSLGGVMLRLHPVHRNLAAADVRAQTATFDAPSARFNLPARTAVVWVLP